MTMQENLSKLWESILRIRAHIKQLQKYNSNRFYKEQYDDEIIQLNRDYKYFQASIKNPNESLKEKLDNLDESMKIILGNRQHQIKLETIKKLERFWPDLEIVFEDVQTNEPFFKIPKEIPMNDQRLDLEEAIRAYDADCYLSSLVMCRRAYEGALVELYKLKTKGDPIEDELCPKCNKKIRTKYVGIKKLHKWAIKETIITEKLESVGFLAADLGAGGAHPPLVDFPREPEVAKLGIQATITLLNEIYKNVAK